MTKEQRTAMARIISDMIKTDNIIEVFLHRQRSSTNSIILPSLHGNVAILMYGTDIIHIFAARNSKNRLLEV